MDPRLLTACRLLMEVTAAQLERAEASGLEDESAGQDLETPEPVAGDNPQFDPGRFASMKQRRHTPPGAPGQTRTAPGAPGTTAPAAQAASFAAPGRHPAWAADMTAPPVAATGGAGTVFPVPQDMPVAAMTMQDISDHFERDARRY